MKRKDFWKECKEKQVVNKLSLYVVTSWLLIQVLGSVSEPLGLPKESVTILLIVLFIGFPINMFLVWKYRLKALEVRKPKKNKEGIPIPGKFKKSAFKKMYFSSMSIFSIISLIFVVWIVNKKFMNGVNISKIESSDKIAILKFGNNTLNTENDIIGKMAVDWIAHGITENKVAQVISPEIVDKYEKVLKASLGPEQNVDLLKDYLLPEKIISGNYFLKDGKLLFQCSIKKGDLSKTLISFKPVECEAEDPMECIESLKQLVLGYLSTVEKGQLNLQESPPKYKAYQYVLNAKENYDKGDIYLDYLTKAIEVDSNYFYPKILRVGHYYNEGEFKKADSLLKLIKPFSERQKRQNNLIKLYEAVLNGENDKTVEYMKVEYNFTPFDLETNSSLMVVTQQFVNKPEDVDTIFNAIPALGLDVKDCLECEYRVSVKVHSDIELGKYREAIDILNEVNKSLDSFYLKKTLITAYVRSGDTASAENVLADLKMTSSDYNLKDAYLFTGKEFIMMDQKEKADVYFNRIIQMGSMGKNDENYAQAFYFKSDMNSAVEKLLPLYHMNPENPDIITKLAIAYTLSNDQQKADKYLKDLQQLSIDYQFGEIDYAFAQYYAAIDDKEMMLKHLLKSVSKGLRFKNDTYHNDPHFFKYRNESGFQKVLKFWH